MAKFTFYLFILTFFFKYAYSQTYPVPGQGKDFPLHTTLSEKFVENFYKAYNFEHFNKKAVLNYRNSLQGKADSDDVRAQFLLAQCYDLFEFGIGEEKDVSTAMSYYLKAANQNYAVGEFILYKMYRYGFMNIKVDSVKAVSFLRRAEKHGDNEVQSEVYNEMAGLYYKEPQMDSEGIPEITPNDSTIFYLTKAIEADPKNTWAIDFLGGIYEDNREYQKSAIYKEKTANEQNWIVLAEWYIKGDKLKKDVPKGLKLLYKACEKVNAYGEGYMGATHPSYYLNKLYYCDKLITKEQVSKYLQSDFICD